MKWLRGILWILFTLCYLHAQSQNCTKSTALLPTKCFEIESELVDACTSQEGLDEMVRLRIGPNPIPLNSIVNIIWTSNNPWQGWATFNNTNLNKMNTINSKIASAGNCGRVIPLNPGQTIPAYAHFMIITSILFNENAQDFSGLTDTLYVALQNNNSITTGHFNNFGTSATRTFIIGTSTCWDTATYDRSNLVRANGTKGAENGSTVLFTPNGVPTYVNYGCKIPQIPLACDAGDVNNVYCTGALVLLSGLVAGSDCFNWFPENRDAGFFVDSTNLNTMFSIREGFSGTVKLYLKAFGNCNTSILDSVIFTVSPPDIVINIVDLEDSVYCVGSTLHLNTMSNSTNAVTWTSNGWGTFSSLFDFNITYTPSSLDINRIVWFKISQTADCGKPSDSIAVRFIAKPSALFQPSDTIVCITEKMIALNPQVLGGKFVSPYVSGYYFNTPAIAGKYPIWYIVSNQVCADSMLVTIEVKPMVNAAFTLSDSIICKGEPVTINALNTGGVFSGASFLGNLVNTQSPGDLAIQYKIDNGACVDSVVKNLKIEDNGNPAFNLSDTVVCEGDPMVNLLPTATNGRFSGNHVLGSSFDPSEAGYFKIMHVVGTGKCSDTSYHYIRVLPKPDASFRLSSVRVTVFDTITFTYTGSMVSSYFWSMGDGNTSTQKNVTHVYQKDEMYPVYLMVENAVGCLDTAYLNLEVESQEFVFFPNAFTPNANGTNDRYLISYLGIRNFHISIYNRWGQLVYESGDINEGWDGKTKGEECSSDVYFYVATYTNKKGLPRSKSGNITLLR